MLEAALKQMFSWCLNQGVTSHWILMVLAETLNERAEHTSDAAQKMSYLYEAQQIDQVAAELHATMPEGDEADEEGDEE